MALCRDTLHRLAAFVARAAGVHGSTRPMDLQGSARLVMTDCVPMIPLFRYAPSESPDACFLTIPTDRVVDIFI